VIGLDAVARELERGQRLRLAFCRRRIDFGRADAHAYLGQIEAIEFQRQLQKRTVAIDLHLVDDVPHGFLDVLRRLALDGEEGAETRRKVGALAIQSKRHGLILPGFQVNG